MSKQPKICYYQSMAKKTQKKTSFLSTLTSFRPSKKIWVVIIVIIILISLFVRKDILLAATVNGTPITTLELFAHLNQQYRTQGLNQLINEKLILGEARKNGLTVSDQEINARLSQFEEKVGGAQALDTLLSQQGQSKTTLVNQIKIQLLIEKLYSKEASASTEEVDKFIAQNKDSLQATTSAEQTKEATEVLKEQKLNQVFNEKFQQLKQQAKIQIF